MNKKLIVYLLVVCLTFSFGIAQAQNGGDNASQNMSQNMSQQGNAGMTGNMSTTGNVSTLANKTLNVSQQEGGDVKWILPGPRRLDPQIFGTPDMPLGFEPEIGVPVENRTVNGNMFNMTTMPTPFSDNFTRINGSFMMDLSDETPVDVNQSRDGAVAEFNFTDPTGQINYRVVLTEITRVGQFHPVFGGVVIDGIAHGKTGIDTRLEPTSYVYGAVWGVGELYINDTLVGDNRVIHAMATERLRSPDQQGYRLLFDNELPHRGIQAHVLLPDMIMAENGTMVKQPVPTNFTLPNGQEQPFLHIAFDNPQMQGLEVLNFNNATMAPNMTPGNMTGNMTQNMTGNMTQNMTGNMTQNQTTGGAANQQDMAGNNNSGTGGADNNDNDGTAGNGSNNAGDNTVVDVVGGNNNDDNGNDNFDDNNGGNAGDDSNNDGGDDNSGDDNNMR
ncbi:MAG: hypothetical protein ACPK85_05115 [Methanosarcina sp.]